MQTYTQAYKLNPFLRRNAYGYWKNKAKTSLYYSTFGAPMPGLTYTANTAYRFGFNGKENDNEVKGTGNQQDYGMRIYDPRLGRFLSIDPLQKDYPSLSPYQFAGNTPLWAVDLDGGEPKQTNQGPSTQSGSKPKPPTAIERLAASAVPAESKSTSKPNSRQPGAQTPKVKSVNRLNAKYEQAQAQDNTATNHQAQMPPVSESPVRPPAQKVFQGEGFDVDKAVSTLNDNAQGQSTGKCARYVRIALEAGGINTNPRPVSAKAYGPYLLKWGFIEIPTTKYTPVTGDISVIQPYEGGSIHGHIQMYNGTQWISDFRQRDFWPGSGYRKQMPDFTIFRWNSSQIIQ